MQDRDKRRGGGMKKDGLLIGAVVALLFLCGTAHATIWYVPPDSALKHRNFRDKRGG
jgi:quinol-cytochrome oxidoreductase complex cytochrome b subunit